MTYEEICYALNKQVPCMRVEVILHTHYGDLHLYDRDAAMVAAVVQRLLEDKLQQLKQ